MYSCGHTVCRACADEKDKERDEKLSISSRILCDICQSSSDSLLVHPILKEKLEELQLFCPIHLRKTFNFNKSLEIVFCEFCSNNKEEKFFSNLKDIVPLDKLEETMHGMLQKKYLDTKDLMTKPSRKFIILTMDKDIMSQYRALKFLSFYNRSSFECDFKSFHSESPESSLRFDSNNFHILCQKCTSDLPYTNQNHLIEISGKNLSQLAEKKLSELNSKKNFRYLIWSSVLKHRVNNSQMNFAFLAEVCVMVAKKKLNFIENLACIDCDKLYSTGGRFPLLLSCFHIKCFSCFLSDKTCRICLKPRKVSSRVLALTFKKMNKNCISCKNSIQVPGALPFKLICHCVICSHCMRSPVISCKCRASQKLVTRLYPRLNKRLLMMILSKSLPLDVELSGQVEIKADQKKKCLCTLPGDLNKTNDCLEHVIKKIDSRKFNYFSYLPEKQAYFRGFLNLYKNIFPVSRDDRRVFDTQILRGGKYFMTIETEEIVQIKGFIICGCVGHLDRSETVKGSFSVSDWNYNVVNQEFSVGGAAEFCKIGQKVIGNKFSVEMMFLDRYFMFSGSNLDEFRTNFKSEGIEFRVFNGHENTGLLYGPISGILFKKFIS
jgi:hypothetical protein